MGEGGGGGRGFMKICPGTLISTPAMNAKRRRPLHLPPQAFTSKSVAKVGAPRSVKIHLSLLVVGGLAVARPIVTNEARRTAGALGVFYNDVLSFAFFAGAWERIH